MDEERYDIEAKCLHNTREVSPGGGGEETAWVGPGCARCGLPVSMGPGRQSLSMKL